MANKAILKRTGIRPNYQENNLETTASGSATPVFDGTAFVLSDVEPTAPIETAQISPSACRRLFKWFVLLIGIFGRALNWLNGSGGSEIDIQRMKTHNDQHVGLRRLDL